MHYIRQYNKNPKPLKWKYAARRAEFTWCQLIDSVD